MSSASLVRSFSNCARSSPCVDQPSHSRMIGLSMIRKSTSYPAMIGWNSAGGSPYRCSSSRIAGSSRLSTGLPSSTQSSSASRSAGTPGRPRREWRSTALRKAAGDASPVVTTCPTACRHGRRIQRAQVAQCAQDVGGPDVGAQDRREVLQVAWPVHARCRRPRRVERGGGAARRRGRPPVGGCPTGTPPSGVTPSRRGRRPSRRRRSPETGRSDADHPGDPGCTGSSSPNSIARYHDARRCRRARTPAGHRARDVRGRTGREA